MYFAFFSSLSPAKWQDKVKNSADYKKACILNQAVSQGQQRQPKSASSKLIHLQLRYSSKWWWRVCNRQLKVCRSCFWVTVPRANTESRARSALGDQSCFRPTGLYVSKVPMRTPVVVLSQAPSTRGSTVSVWLWKVLFCQLGLAVVTVTFRPSIRGVCVWPGNSHSWLLHGNSQSWCNRSAWRRAIMGPPNSARAKRVNTDERRTTCSADKSKTLCYIFISALEKEGELLPQRTYVNAVYMLSQCCSK